MTAAEFFVLVDPTGDFDIYGRLSKDKSGKVVTVEEQVAKVRAVEEAKGHRLRAVWSDRVSAYDPTVERPGFLAMCAAIKAGETPKRIAAREDARFSRQTAEGAMLIALAAGAGVWLVMGGREVDPDDPVSQGMAEMGSVMAAIDSKIKSKNVRIAHEVLARNGAPHGGPRPFGYLKDGMTPDEHGIDDRPAEAPLYRELVRRLCAGESPGTIATDWESRGIRAHNGDVFNMVRLRALAISPRHAGLRVHRGEIIGKAAWPGLVTPEDRLRVIAGFASRLSPRAPRGANGPVGPTLLQGLIFCAGTLPNGAPCGHKLRLNVKRKTVRFYRCPSTKGPACGGVAVRVALVDDEVESRFLAALTDKKVQRMLARQRAAVPEIGALLSRRDRVDGDMAMLHEMRKRDEIDRDDYRRQIRELTSEKRDIARELESASLPLAITTDPETLIEKWDSLLTEEKRANLMALIERVEVIPRIESGGNKWNPDRVTVIWRDAIVD